uniref:Cyclic nucleotide-binding domain-containing protein n=1 Tax=Pyramimonas obovata TaxID=1411642 RepID=A0A7S0WP47_9CHLO|mmetsp:Transcript_33073/g.72114  ORF Transcript_33073/g.72114 Transcript_33073/m.72114 type:complete len:513 (+) Transcript_33073:153-1691(+)|eukprot:CAMPEP_0118922628 /NCGR_PEP_ID=MMETSP1169-20130426/1496_1 /TAXON_ID=36882 /ORGANISM="Pyramimonas obovata, Strain CCMP722" /LENGTH=512 /DNA_ID=CAMNT_0006863539 /DNA_START=154 /DNA_END=1692 /DNA_ORIENTATION=+
MGSGGQITNAAHTDGAILKKDVDKVFQDLLVKCFREEESESVLRVVGYVREMRSAMWNTPMTVPVPTADYAQVHPTPHIELPSRWQEPQKSALSHIGTSEFNDCKVKLVVKHEDPEKDEYLNQYLDIGSLFSQMCEQMADEQPVEPLEYVIESLQFVRQQFKEIERDIDASPSPIHTKYSKKGSSVASSNHGSHPGTPKSPNFARRGSVSAECAGDRYDVKVRKGSMVIQDFAKGSIPEDHVKIPNVPKSPEERARLLLALKQAVLFNGLEDSVLQIVVDAGVPVEYPAGSVVYRQGALGTHYFVINEGTLDITIAGDPGRPPKMKCTRGPLESFGELSIMYNSPRSVTATALTAVKLWSIDRRTFHTAVSKVTRTREQLSMYIRRVPILANLSNQQFALLGDVTQRAIFSAGEIIIEQGNMGDTFYMIEQGEAEASIATTAGPSVVKTYTEGDFFGELSLLMGGPRAATVRATRSTQCMVVDAMNFNLLIAPFVDFRERVTEYQEALARAC